MGKVPALCDATGCCFRRDASFLAAPTKRVETRMLEDACVLLQVRGPEFSRAGAGAAADVGTPWCMCVCVFRFVVGIVYCLLVLLCLERRFFLFFWETVRRFLSFDRLWCCRLPPTTQFHLSSLASQQRSQIRPATTVRGLRAAALVLLILINKHAPTIHTTQPPPQPQHHKQSKHAVHQVPRAPCQETG